MRNVNTMGEKGGDRETKKAGGRQFGKKTSEQEVSK